MGDHEDRPTNSLEEDDPQEQDVGLGIRSYECMYCKRGFTTAQALGGHMNIHRKDRAKSSKVGYLSNHNSNKQEEDDHGFYANPRFYHPVFASYPPSYVSTTPSYDQEGNRRYTGYNSSISSSSRAINHENSHHQEYVHGVTTSPSREEKMMSLSLQFGWSHGDDKDSRRRIRGGNEEDELDLELRLGQA